MLDFLGWIIIMICFGVIYDRQSEIWKKIDTVEKKINKGYYNAK